MEAKAKHRTFMLTDRARKVWGRVPGDRRYGGQSPMPDALRAQQPDGPSRRNASGARIVDHSRNVARVPLQFRQDPSRRMVHLIQRLNADVALQKTPNHLVFGLCFGSPPHILH